jgi:hypothetical protein
MKKLLVVFVLLIIAMLVVTIRSKDAERAINRPTSVATSSSPTTDSHSHMDYAVKGRVPAYYETQPPSNTLPNTLSPELFTGNKRLAYQAAKEIPQTLAQLPCYCHCDRGHGHKSLHSCFESEHGENCGICIGEALMAHNLKKRGVSVTEIRKQIITAYGESQ